MISKKSIWFSLAAAIVLVPLVSYVMAAPPTPVDRTRTILSYIRNQTTGDNIDLVDNPTGDKWISFFYEAYGPLLDADGEPRDYSDLNAMEKGTFYLNQQRKWHREVRKGNIRRAASTAADEAAADADTETDLGADE